MISKRNLILIVSGLVLAAGQAGGDYLDGSGPDYSEWRSYFSDPIFFSGGTPSKVDYGSLYPYFGSGIFKEPASLGGSSKTPSVLGKVAGKLAEMRENASLATANQSTSEAVGPSYGRMIDPDTLPSSKNWTRTMEYARNRSSMRVFESGNWTEPQDVQNMY